MSKDTLEAGDIRTQKDILYYVAEVDNEFVKTLYKRKTYTFSNWCIGDFMRNTQYVGHQNIMLDDLFSKADLLNLNGPS